MNIKSPATKALLHLATPVKIAADEVIITFKNDKLVSQINDTNKKQMLAEAANIMFNTDVKVTIRLPMAGDNEITAAQKKNLTTDNIIKPPVAEVIKEQPSQEQKKEVPLINQPAKTQDEANKSQTNDTKISEDGAKKIESDQEKMIMDLFDGKYIE